MGRAQTILVVDDHEDSLELCRTLLELEGYIVHAFSDPKAAFVALQSMDPPALILLDMLMPAMDGLGFLRSLEANAALSTIPVVVLSAAPQEAVRSARRFLLKPIAPEALLSAVGEACGAG